MIDMIDNRIRQPTFKNIKTSPVFIIGCDRSGTTLLRLMLIQSQVLYNSDSDIVDVVFQVKRSLFALRIES